ncbi:hypothetical protein BGZ79_009419 [Entomortierella chlamydospora]|nr:hypothetical protein BGZ79_009419 [Entomortierella chlamydospora]
MKTPGTSSESTGPGGAESLDGTTLRPSLKRDASLIIPSMIPTQEVLQNLNLYRDNGMIQLGGDEDEIDDDIDSEDYHHSNHSPHSRNSDNGFVPSTYNDPDPVIQPNISKAKGATPLPPSSSGPSLFLRTYPRKRALSPRRAQAKLEAEDSDPIIDFDESDEDEELLHRTLPVSPHRPSKSLQGRSPQSPQLRRPLIPAESPSRRFIIPLATQPIRGNRHSPARASSATTVTRFGGERPAPDSPSKRLRPLSEIPRPIVPMHLQAQQSPSRRNSSSGSSGSPRKQRAGQLQPSSAVKSPSSRGMSTGMVVTTKSSSMAKPPKAIQPPAALGPQLQQIANEMRNGHAGEEQEQEEQEEEPLVRRRKGMGEARVEHESLFLSSPGMALLTSNFNSEPYAGSPELGPIAKKESGINQILGEHSLPVSSSSSAMELKKEALESPFWVPGPPAISSSKTTGQVCIKREESLTPVLARPEKVQKEVSSWTNLGAESSNTSRTPIHQQKLGQRADTPSLSDEIPLPGLILEFASKLTPLDHIKWPPAKVGRFHILGLVIFVNAEEKVVTKKGPTIAKREITICDQSATSFKLNLWAECCKWADCQFKAGDAVLITDVQPKEFRQKITGSTSVWSRMARLDGTLLASYRGHDTIELYMKIFIEKRRCLALDLLDKGKGIARDPSLYLTHHMWSVPGEISSSFTAGDSFDDVEHHYIKVEGSSPPRKPTNDYKGPGLALLSTTSSTMPRNLKKESEGGSNSIFSSVSSTANSESTMSVMASTITGASLRASVTYKMLVIPGDEENEWEIGAVMQNGRSVKIQCENGSSWINDALPGRVMIFYGKFKEGSDIFYIDASARKPSLLRESSWDDSLKSVKSRKFQSIKSLREHKFMGDAILDAYILAISSPDFFLDDGDERAKFDFIQCYCTVCQSIAVSSPQNPSILFCRECQLSQKRDPPLEWRYPAFELSLGDKPRMGANLTSECIQLRCQSEIGDQVFVSVPARRWMRDREGFWESRARWKRLVELMNRQGENVVGDDERDSEASDNNAQKLRVEVKVGVNMMVKALKVEYV